MDEFNPYSAPEAGVAGSPLVAEAEEGRGVWRDGKILVMAKVARLPSRCVKCNAPATYRLWRKFSWHTPWLFLMVIFPGLLFYAIVALIVRKTAKVELPLCDVHKSRRSKGIAIGWVVSLAGIGLFFVAVQSGLPDELVGVLGLIGLVLLLAGLIYGLVRSQTVVAQKIDATHVWLKKVGLPYLAELPNLPGSEESQGSGKGTQKIGFDEL